MALALLLSGCDGSTREEILGLGGSTAGGTGAGVSGGGGARDSSGAADGGGGSGGQGAEGGAGDTASGDGGSTAGTGPNGTCVPRGDPGDAGAAALDGGSPENLIPDPSFESGHVAWVGLGTAAVSDWTC